MAQNTSQLPPQTMPFLEEGKNEISWPWYSWLTRRFLELRDLLRVFNTSTSATAGSASALPSNPLGYIISELPDGTRVKIPYYNL